MTAKHIDVPELPPNRFLQEMFRTGKVEHPSGRMLDFNSGAAPGNCMALYRFVMENRPSIVVEIGMAFGASTLSGLTGLAANGTGRMISVDPYPKWTTAMEACLRQIELSGFSGIHQHIRLPSCEALPDLVKELAGQVDLVYIDGHHTFDHALIDFFYGDRLLREGGVVVFNDASWPAVHRVIRFVLTHRDYEEIEVGLPRKFHGGNVLGTLLRRVQGRSTLDRYFRKKKVLELPYNFYKKF